MSDIKIVGWPKRPAEQRRDQLERENAELRKLVEQKDAALKQALVYAEAHANRTGDKHAKKDVGAIRAALEAAERGGE